MQENASVKADYVVPVPDSGVASAIGYSGKQNSFRIRSLRNHYVGRTFIEPQQHIRNFGVKLKLNSVKDVLKNKKVIVIDDSICFRTTCRKIIKMIKDAGAKGTCKNKQQILQDSCCYGIIHQIKLS